MSYKDLVNNNEFECIFESYGEEIELTDEEKVVAESASKDLLVDAFQCLQDVHIALEAVEGETKEEVSSKKKETLKQKISKIIGWIRKKIDSFIAKLKSKFNVKDKVETLSVKAIAKYISDIENLIGKIDAKNFNELQQKVTEQGSKVAETKAKYTIESLETALKELNKKLDALNSKFITALERATGSDVQKLTALSATTGMITGMVTKVQSSLTVAKADAAKKEAEKKSKDEKPKDDKETAEESVTEPGDNEEELEVTNESVTEVEEIDFSIFDY